MATWRGFIPASTQKFLVNSGVDTAGTDECSVCYSYKHATLPAFGSAQAPLGILGGAAGAGDINMIWGIIYHEKDAGGDEWVNWQWTSAYGSFQSRRKSTTERLLWTTAPQTIVLTLKRSTGALRVWLGGSEMTDSNGTGSGFNGVFCPYRARTIGERSDGGSKFSGNIGRITTWSRLLTPEEAINLSIGRDPALALYATNRIEHVSMGTGLVASDNETSLAGVTFAQTNNPAVATVPDGVYTASGVQNNAWWATQGQFLDE